jgi:hypothetical protein
MFVGKGLINALSFRGLMCKGCTVGKYNDVYMSFNFPKKTPIFFSTLLISYEFINHYFNPSGEIYEFIGN